MIENKRRPDATQVAFFIKNGSVGAPWEQNEKFFPPDRHLVQSRNFPQRDLWGIAECKKN
ncbi:MAG: hypothetical protein DMG20_02015 [Acidobacteria bacterium]|nr:MAG: hypothetical protein DMG20_02015 [Acidobacteriota bacterium]